MANWTDLSGVFTFGSKLTSTQMQNFRDNSTAITEGSSGAPKILPTAHAFYTAGSAWSISMHGPGDVTSTAQNSNAQQFMQAAYIDRYAASIAVGWSVGVQSWGTGATVWSQTYVNSVIRGPVNSHGNATGTAKAWSENITSLIPGDLVQITGYTDRACSVSPLTFSASSASAIGAYRPALTPA